MASSHQGSFKEYVELTPNNGAGTRIVANTIEWNLPKTGIVKSALIKFVFSGATMDAGAVAGDIYTWYKGLVSARVCNTLQLRTYSRVLLELTGDMIEELIERSPLKQHHGVLGGNGSVLLMLLDDFFMERQIASRLTNMGLLLPHMPLVRLIKILN